jgi:hypothetical protein
LGAGVFFRYDLQPAVWLQRLDVAAEGGDVQLQNLADLGGSRQISVEGKRLLRGICPQSALIL